MRVVPRVVIVSESEHKASLGFSQRLHRPGEFSAVMEVRRVVRGECFDLHFGRDSTDGVARLGWIVPKRLARNAALRNAVKRQGREAFRLAAHDLAPRDLVFRLKRTISGARPTDEQQRKTWRTEIESLLRKLPAVSSLK